MSNENTRTLTSICIYPDKQDPTNIGWAYLVDYSDGHQDSGSHDGTDPDDDVVAAMDEIADELGLDVMLQDDDDIIYGCGCYTLDMVD